LAFAAGTGAVEDFLATGVFGVATFAATGDFDALACGFSLAEALLEVASVLASAAFLVDGLAEASVALAVLAAAGLAAGLAAAGFAAGLAAAGFAAGFVAGLAVGAVFVAAFDAVFEVVVVFGFVAAGVMTLFSFLLDAGVVDFSSTCCACSGCNMRDKKPRFLPVSGCLS